MPQIDSFAAQELRATPTTDHFDIVPSGETMALAAEAGKRLTYRRIGEALSRKIFT